MSSFSLKQKRGNRNPVVFIRQPPLLKEEFKWKTTKRLANVLLKMSENLQINVADVLMSVARRPGVKATVQRYTNVEKNIDEERDIAQSHAFISHARVSNRQYEEIQHFSRLMFNVRLGVPLKKLQVDIKLRFPESKIHYEAMPLQVGSKGMSTTRKVRNCGYAEHKFPEEVLSERCASLRLTGRFEDSNAFSNYSCYTLQAAFNID
jgi:hypothetical protein